MEPIDSPRRRRPQTLSATPSINWLWSWSVAFWSGRKRAYISSTSSDVAARPRAPFQASATRGRLSKAAICALFDSPIGSRASAKVISTPHWRKISSKTRAGARLPWSITVPAQSTTRPRICWNGFSLIRIVPLASMTHSCRRRGECIEMSLESGPSPKASPGIYAGHRRGNPLRDPPFRTDAPDLCDSQSKIKVFWVPA